MTIKIYHENNLINQFDDYNNLSELYLAGIYLLISYYGYTFTYNDKLITEDIIHPYIHVTDVYIEKINQYPLPKTYYGWWFKAFDKDYYYHLIKFNSWDFVLGMLDINEDLELEFRDFCVNYPFDTNNLSYDIIGYDIPNFNKYLIENKNLGVYYAMKNYANTYEVDDYKDYE